MEYFRSALKCDRTVAAASPLPLYDVPANDDTSAAQPSADGALPQQVGRAAAASLHDSVRCSRSAYDTAHSSDVRIAAKRETNVLVHLAEREAADKRRAEEVERLTERLLVRLKEERLAGIPDECGEESKRHNPPRGEMSSKEADVDEGGEENSILQQTIRHQTARELTVLVKSVLSNKTEASRSSGGHPRSVLEPCPPVEFFDRIKIEEERVLRNQLVAKRPGGIAALYNSITLDRALHPPALGLNSSISLSSPPSVAVQEEPLASAIIPAKVSELVSAGCGAKELQRVKDRRAEDAARIQDKLRDLRRQDEEELEHRRQRAMQVDHERQTMLSELVAQDLVRQETRRLEKQSVDELISSRAAASSFINLSGPLSGDVLKSLLVAQRKPMHPVDVYQQTVRAEMGLPQKI